MTLEKVWAVFIFIIVLSFLIIIHELGHYLVAKLFKVHVEEFGLGYPPRALKLFQRGSTLFSLNWIPFGGFVKMEGEDGPEEEERQTHMKSEFEFEPDQQEQHKKQFVNFSATSNEQPFYTKSRPSRLAIILAGASVNFIFGVIAFSIYFSVLGIPSIAPNPRIGAVMDGSPAAQSHLPANVDITGIKINGQETPIHTIDEATALITQHMGEHLTIVATGNCEDLKCDPQTHDYDVYVRRKDETPADQGAVGIRFQPLVVPKFYPWYEMPFRGAWYGVQQALGLSYFILMSLGQIVQTASHGKVPQGVASPVGIFQQADDLGFFSHGAMEVLNFAGILSVNLAIMNVLPIPALDGGRAFFILLEYVIGKKSVAKVENRAHTVGFVVLVSLLMVVFVKDIVGLFVH